MSEGTIKKFSGKGYGFIKTSVAKDRFFQSKNLQDVSFDELYEGQTVMLTEGQGRKGPQAENVRPV
jgi:cold shock protein